MSGRSVVVIGAGVTGAAAAWQLARRGDRVTVLEQFEDGHTRGSSHGSSRIFRLGYPDPFWVRRCREALAEWRELEDQAGIGLVVATGSVDHGDPASVADVVAALDEEDVPDRAARRRPSPPTGGRACASTAPSCSRPGAAASRPARRASR